MPKQKIGLEIHVYLKMDTIKEKLFCQCKLDKTAEPNTHICPICTGQPGNKPMLPNKDAINKILSIALMLGCTPNITLMFQRKHYSWPDLPSGYQRTMSGSYSVPVGENGEFQGIRIREVHLEEDPAAWNPDTGQVDYNRSGYPLAEIVTEPDFTSSDQVRTWLKELMVTLSYLNAVDRKAGIKSDVNVSVSPAFQRVEIKNVNSFTNIVKTIDVEAKRQTSLLAAGTPINQETRAYSEAKNETIFMRSKEDAIDYMFIPEPDLPSILITPSQLKELKKNIPKQPEEIQQELTTEFKLKDEDAHVLSRNIILANLFLEVAPHSDPHVALTFIRRELPRIAGFHSIELDEMPVTAKQLIDIMKFLQEKKITDSQAKKVLEQLFVQSFDVKSYIAKHQLGSIQDESEIENACKEVICKNPAVVQDYLSGKEESINYLIGQVMRSTKGKADAKNVKTIIKKLIR